MLSEEDRGEVGRTKAIHLHDNPVDQGIGSASTCMKVQRSNSGKGNDEMNHTTLSSFDASLGFNEDPLRSDTMPATIYTSEDVFDFEMEHIFAKSWLFVGHKNDFSKPGDFVRKDIGKESVIVMKGRDDQIRAFHNVCRHRAHRLVSEDRGRLGAVITCPYHSWAYGLNGELRAASVKEGVLDFDPVKCGLVPVRLEEYASFIFMNLDDNAPTMADWGQGYDERLRSRFKDIDNPKYHSKKVYEIDANWKVVMDNGIDNYHFARSGPHHKALDRMCDFKNAEVVADSVSMAIVAGPARADNGGYDFSHKPDFWQSENFVDELLWPSVFFLTFPYTDMIFTFDIIPISAQKCKVEMVYYTVSDELDDTSLAAINYMNEELGPEDVALNVGVQQGLNSRAYHTGRFMVDADMGYDGEQLIHNFYRLWLASFDGESRKSVLQML